MESVLIAAWVAAAPLAAASAQAPTAPAELDMRCFQLMAELAEDEDPRIRATGRIAAQYFLGRIDAAAPGAEIDPASGVAAGDEREALLRRCGDAMQAGGRDFRTIGEALAAPASPAA
ncbi:MAG TPA: hypothetical protein VN231_09860 [Allosphingosinicella sp.]|nr:hypothetical protein [Allosphingosinicella sp.]